MKIYGIHSSTSENCGVSIFNEHLKQSLQARDIHLESINIFSNLPLLNNRRIVILHYMPTAYCNEQSSRNLIHFLKYQDVKNLVVIFHKVYLEDEKKYLKDTICPLQEEHLKLIFKKSRYLIALSKSVEANLKTWLVRFDTNAVIKTLDHPGLFIPASSNKFDFPYAFFGGIFRSTKNCYNYSTSKLIKLCNEKQLPIWIHWTNDKDLKFKKITIDNVWKQTSGLLSDLSWSEMITNAKVILCPYQTRIQNVSGLISEAISARCYVLSTSFECSVEMQKRFPSLIFLNDDIEEWPDIIEKLFLEPKLPPLNYLNWNEFSENLIPTLAILNANEAVY